MNIIVILGLIECYLWACLIWFYSILKQPTRNSFSRLPQENTNKNTQTQINEKHGQA